MCSLGFTLLKNSKPENLQFWHSYFNAIVDLSATASDKIALKLFETFTKIGREKFKETLMELIQPDRLKED